MKRLMKKKPKQPTKEKKSRTDLQKKKKTLSNKTETTYKIRDRKEDQSMSFT
jgi:hypothetical protein